MAVVRLGLCLNLKMNAISQYANYDFNSFCMFNGKPLAASVDGIFELDSAQTDHGTLIDAFVELVSTDFGTTNPKRIRSAHIGYETSGYLVFKVKTDDNNEVAYEMQPDKTAQKQYGEKVPLSRMQRGVTWMFRVENRDGCDFSLDAIDLVLVPLHSGR
jgi:hypothetical protein